MFVQISLFKDYNASLPNRGQDGLAKRVIYGDDVRQRISSQCLKAGLRGNQPLFAMIDGDEAADDMRSFADRLGIGLAHRSRHVFDTIVVPALSKDFGDDEEAKSWGRAFADLFLKPGDAGKSRTDEDSKTYSSGYLDQPLVIGEREAEAIVAGAKVFREAGICASGGAGDLRDLFEKRGTSKKIIKALLASKKISADQAEAKEKALDDAVANIRSVRSHAGLDGALFGRMATGSVVSRVESCVHVAHAITVHAIQASADYFSVQDSLSEEDDPGASHTNNTEIASGLFYEYAVIDVRQLMQNFSGFSAEQQAETVAWIVRAFYASECSAKRGSTAGYGAGLYFLAETGRRQPRTLAAAFQKALPIKGSDPMWRRAVSILTDHREDMNLKGGSPATAYDTEDQGIREAARNSNKPVFEVIADRVKADVLSWLQTQQAPVQAAAAE
jgi:CRISPR system Cascade subunit CasC